MTGLTCETVPMHSTAPGREAFVVGFVPGVVPDKWARKWRERCRRPLSVRVVEEREQVPLLRSGELDMCLARGVERGEDLHVIPLHVERPVLVVAREHPAAAYDELDVADLADDIDVLASHPGISLADAFATVAAGTGYLVVPGPVARVNSRKDVTVLGALGVPGTRIGLAWRVDHQDPDLDTFIGIVRGRTPRSSR